MFRVKKNIKMNYKLKEIKYKIKNGKYFRKSFYK